MFDCNRYIYNIFFIVILGITPQTYTTVNYLCRIKLVGFLVYYGGEKHEPQKYFNIFIEICTARAKNLRTDHDLKTV